MIKNNYLPLLFQLVFLLFQGYFCTFISVCILAKIIRKMNQIYQLRHASNHILSQVIEKYQKFGSVEINTKHSTIFFRKVAAPIGQKIFKIQLCVKVLSQGTKKCHKFFCLTTHYLGQVHWGKGIAKYQKLAIQPGSKKN